MDSSWKLRHRFPFTKSADSLKGENSNGIDDNNSAASLAECEKELYTIYSTTIADEELNSLKDSLVNLLVVCPLKSFHTSIFLYLETLRVFILKVIDKCDELCTVKKELEAAETSYVSVKKLMNKKILDHLNEEQTWMEEREKILKQTTE